MAGQDAHFGIRLAQNQLFLANIRENFSLVQKKVIHIGEFSRVSAKKIWDPLFRFFFARQCEKNFDPPF